MMFYKRKEIFRYTFGKPLEAKISPVEETEKSDCLIIDISPGGAQVYSVLQLEPKSTPMFYFKLSNDYLVVKGIVVWKKPYKDGALYGIDFEEDNEMEELIIDQLKIRRREEQMKKKIIR